MFKKLLLGRVCGTGISSNGGQTKWEIKERHILTQGL